MKNALLISGLWATLVVGFLLSAETIPWHVSLPVTGFLWAGVPTAITPRRPRGPIAVVSVVLFAALTAGFLVLTWFALAFVGGVGHVLFELDPDYEGAAQYFTWAGLAGFGGALAGVATGARLPKRPNRQAG